MSELPLQAGLQQLNCAQPHAALGSPQLHCCSPQQHQREMQLLERGQGRPPRWAEGWRSSAVELELPLPEVTQAGVAARDARGMRSSFHSKLFGLGLGFGVPVGERFGPKWLQVSVRLPWGLSGSLQGSWRLRLCMEQLLPALFCMRQVVPLQAVLGVM